MKDCTFFIVTHKVFDVPKIPNYYPIIVGGKDINLVNSYHDNIGDNIAEKNSNFCELTKFKIGRASCRERVSLHV